MTANRTQLTANSVRQVVVTVVYGQHAERLDETFSSFLVNPFLEAHAFIVGHSLPKNRVPEIHYHLKAPDPSFHHPMRDVDFRRWLFIDELDADFALVVDGCDVFCLQPIPEIPKLLKGGWLAAVAEHPSGWYVEGRIYIGNFVNAGVTFWDVRASRPLREEIVERGRKRFRTLWDDQLCLNEVVFAKYLDKLTLLPCIYNYRAFFRRKVWGWPVTMSLDGVKIYHNEDWRLAKMHGPWNENPPLVELKADKRRLGFWQHLWRRGIAKFKYRRA